MFYEETFVKTRCKYYLEDKPTEMTNFDARTSQSNSRWFRLDYLVRLCWQYVKSLFLMKPSAHARKGGYAKIVWAYDARKNLIEETLLNTDG